MENTAHNDVTGDRIATKPSDKYAQNYDAIFRKDDHFNELLKDPIDGFNTENANSKTTNIR